MIFSSKDQKKSVMNVKEKDIWQWEKNVKTPYTSRPARPLVKCIFRRWQPVGRRPFSCPGPCPIEVPLLPLFLSSSFLLHPYTSSASATSAATYLLPCLYTASAAAASAATFLILCLYTSFSAAASAATFLLLWLCSSSAAAASAATYLIPCSYTSAASAAT